MARVLDVVVIDEAFVALDELGEGVFGLSTDRRLRGVGTAVRVGLDRDEQGEEGDEGDELHCILSEGCYSNKWCGTSREVKWNARRG